MQDDMAQFDRGIFNNATLIFKKTNEVIVRRPSLLKETETYFSK